MRLSIIIIGDEILIGQVTDTNSGAIARQFGPAGWEITSIATVGDDRAAITNAVNSALQQADLVITTGGLGPTKDDITKAVLMDIFGGELRHDADVAANVRAIFEKRHLSLNALTEAQAMVPTSCRVIQNRFGTAPIMWFEREGKVLVTLPGVPFETEGMLPEVFAQVMQRFAPDIRLLHSTLIVSGITESDLAERLATFESSLPAGIHLAYLPANGYIRLRLDGRGTDDIEPLFQAARQQLIASLGDNLVYDGNATPAEIVLERLRQCGFTIATAESCTGGNIAHRITSIAGCSDVYLGSVVSYANEVKSGLLGVSAFDIARQGAVSRIVVEQMAAGACKKTGANCAVATSGIAGPGGGTPAKPVGTVWIGWCVNGHVESEEFHFPGNRARIIDRATDVALLGLLKRI